MDHISRLWEDNGLPSDFLQHLDLTGDPDTAVQSSFKLGTAAQVSVSLAALSASYVFYLRTGITQRVTVDARHAALAFHSEAFYTINEELPHGEVWDRIAGLYATADDNYVRIHTNFPHHRKGVLDVLGISDEPTLSRTMVANAIKTWNSFEFEETCAQRGLCVTAMRSYDSWKAHPHAQAMQAVPPISINKLSDLPAPKEDTFSDKPSYPLSGLRVLDLTRVLAGPIAGRTLAAHGASVLLVTSPLLPSLPTLDAETSLGKRTTQLDLTNAQDHAKLASLAREAHVFLQAYRPGGLEDKGFGPSDLIQLRKGNGIVAANLTAWGWEGPWRDRRGFDSLVQTATGFNFDEGIAYNTFSGQDKPSPKPFPFQAIDHAAGHLLAFGINIALARIILTGGSYEVRVSLLSTANWIRSLGRLTPARAWALATPFPSKLSLLSSPPSESELRKLSVEWAQSQSTRNKDASGAGDERSQSRMRCLRYPGILEKTPVREGDWKSGGLDKAGGEFLGAPMRLDTHEAEW